MHVIVIGAGVVGVTTAYYLAQRGCRVTVIDRANVVAAGASHANAAQLSYTFTDAMARPEFIARIPGLLAGLDAGSRVSPDLALLPWGLRFLGQCSHEKWAANTVAVLKMALRSAELMAGLRAAVPIEFGHRTVGKLVLLADDAAKASATAGLELKRANGAQLHIVSAGEAIDIEPSLSQFGEEFVAAVYSPSDAVADSRLFTKALSEWLQASADVRFLMGREVQRIGQHEGRFSAVESDGDDIEADAAVVCCGAWSTGLLRPLRQALPVYPVRGYSVTLPAGAAAPHASITVLRRRIVFSRLADRVRIAGFADFSGFRAPRDAVRIDRMMASARHVAPRAADYRSDDVVRWAGLRPMTPDSRPRVGKTGIDRLYLNTGHGILGWTLACATAHDVATAVTGEDPGAH